MTQRTFNRPRTGLERDADGHRTGFKLYIKVRKPMSDDGFRRYGAKARVNIAKSKYIWKYYTSTRAMGLINGVDIEIMKTNKSLGEYLITFAGLSEGEMYGLYGWTAGKTKTFVKLTKPLAIIEIQNVEKMAFKFTKYGRLNRYFFRQKKDNREERNE
jgi:hypothetical protein